MHTRLELFKLQVVAAHGGSVAMQLRQQRPQPLNDCRLPGVRPQRAGRDQGCVARGKSVKRRRRGGSGGRCVLLRGCGCEPRGRAEQRCGRGAARTAAYAAGWLP